MDEAVAALFSPIQNARLEQLPKVSIHLAICNEPPDMVIETLNALAGLDYADYEVLVVDNNTADDALWMPVEAHCKTLGERFKFFHLPKYPGFKAGALNFALRQTHPDVQVVGVIDSDYVVDPDWLKATVPYFAEAKVGFVQGPQDNRGWEGDTFKEMCNWEYAGFFNNGMVQRNERDAIIQHGTMTLIRRRVLEEVGAWGEWTICEDAELGMRLMKAGYESVYVNHVFGRGLVPDSFTGYKKQRFRWVYGAVQILRHRGHWLTNFKNQDFTWGQRFHFLFGWLPWFADALHLAFTAAAVVWTLGILWQPYYFEFPLAAFLLPVLGLFGFKIAHSLALYYVRVKCTWRQKIGAAIAGMSLTHTIALGIWKGLTSDKQPFLRTPKCEHRPALMQGLLMAWEETQILFVLWLCVAAVIFRYGIHDMEVIIWSGILLIQSIPYIAALTISMINVMPSVSVQQWIELPTVRLPEVPVQERDTPK
ncbi:MAG: glycosyltransferase [Thiotrichaceae bacterium]